MGAVSRALASERTEEAFALLWGHCGDAMIAGHLLRALYETQPPPLARRSPRVAAVDELERAAKALAAGDREAALRIARGLDISPLAEQALELNRQRTQELLTSRDCVVTGCTEEAGSDANVCPYHQRYGGETLLGQPEPPRPRRGRQVQVGTHARRPTPAEIRVLQCAARGLTAGETARFLSRSIETVKTHRKRVIHKLGAASMTHAVGIAANLGLISPAL